jgi:hypothetical protein
MGSNQSTNSGEENEIQRRIDQASRVYLSLLPIVGSRVIHRQTKIKLYKSVVRPMIWYASESWTLSKSSKSAVNAFESKVLRTIFGPMRGKSTWKIRYNNELHKQSEEPSMSDIIELKRYQWTGHILCVDGKHNTEKDCGKQRYWKEVCMKAKNMMGLMQLK